MDFVSDIGVIVGDKTFCSRKNWVGSQSASAVSVGCVSDNMNNMRTYQGQSPRSMNPKQPVI